MLTTSFPHISWVFVLISIPYCIYCIYIYIFILRLRLNKGVFFHGFPPSRKTLPPHPRPSTLPNPPALPPINQVMVPGDGSNSDRFFIISYLYPLVWKSVIPILLIF